MPKSNWWHCFVPLLTDNTDSSDTTTSSTEKKITMKIDDEEIMSTSFDETLKTGKIQLSIGKATTDSKTLQGYVSQASNIAVVLDSGKMPIKYDVDENQLYKLIAFYKLIKLERNLFNHMDNGNVENNDECKNKQRMQIDKLDTLIDSYVDTCEKLCQ